MIGFNRNAWSDSAETGGRIQPKRVIAFTRNPHMLRHLPVSCTFTLRRNRTWLLMTGAVYNLIRIVALDAQTP